MLVARCWLLVEQITKGGWMKSYKDLDIYKLSFQLAMKIHEISLKFPQYELYEEGSQIRKSSKRVCACVVEGYGRKKYKNDFIRFLVYSLASCDETNLHLDFVHKAGYINDDLYQSLNRENDELGKKINKFIKFVETEWKE